MPVRHRALNWGKSGQIVLLGRIHILVVLPGYCMTIPPTIHPIILRGTQLTYKLIPVYLMDAIKTGSFLIPIKWHENTAIQDSMGVNR